MAMNQPNDNRSLVSIESQGGIIPGKSEWSLMRDMAASLVPTGFLPESIKTPEQAVAIMLKGRELNVPPMYALSNIAIVKGKPTISAEMMLALIYRDHGKKAIRVKESTNTACTVEYRLTGWDDVSSYTFTIEDAQKANLANSPTWKNYPAAMLRARCISAVARMAFPECIAGMYVPGELGDAVTVTDDGEVVSAPADNTFRQTGNEPDKWGPGTGGGPVVDIDTGEIQEAQTRPAAQAELIDGNEDRDKANKYAHAIAEGLYGDKGHDVLHIMADLKWGHDSLTKCNADELRQLGHTLETKSPEALDRWYDQWIAPRMPQGGE